MRDRENNFNLVRFLAAAAVIYSHSFTTIYGDEAIWLATGIRAEDIGSLSVNVFFVVSGLLITKSWIGQPDVTRFLLARFLRIFPALFVLALVTELLIGPLVSSWMPEAYFADPRTWLYAPLTMTLIDDGAYLPGVFEFAAQKGLVNAPLWTLKYEVLAYVMIAVAGMLGLLATKARHLALLSVFGCAYFAIQFFTDWREHYAMLDNFARMWSCFFVGSAFYLFREKIRLNPASGAALAFLACAAYGTPLFDLTSKIFVAYAVIWFALVPSGAIRRFNQMGDCSYGLYIFAWPLQQIAIQAIPALTPHLHFVLVFPLTLLMAAASWRYVEKPCIRHHASVRGMVDKVMAAMAGNATAIGSTGSQLRRP